MELEGCAPIYHANRHFLLEWGVMGRSRLRQVKRAVAGQKGEVPPETRTRALKPIAGARLAISIRLEDGGRFSSLRIERPRYCIVFGRCRYLPGRRRRGWAFLQSGACGYSGACGNSGCVYLVAATFFFRACLQSLNLEQ